MPFDSSDDDLPDIPMVGDAPHAAPSRGDQLERLEQLEQQFRVLREEMQDRGGSSRQPATAPVVGPTAEAPVAGASPPLAAADASPPPMDAARDEEVQYELRRLVPHLSPEFTCSYRDAVLLVGAIRSGGAGGSTGQTSLFDRLTAVEAERRSLEQRLMRRTDECDNLRAEADQAKQKVRAIQQQAEQSTKLLSLRREEMRKQLLIEESRTEKVQVRNRKLERENEELRSKLRTQLR